MKITIIGTGNVGTVLGRLFKNAGHHMVQVYGRNREHAKTLASEFNCEACNDWKGINSDAELYVAALSDNALYHLPRLLTLPGKLIVHTAGSVPMHVLKPVSESHGILYPLQSIRKEFPPSSGIPLLIDGSDPQVKTALAALASGISPIVKETNDEARARLHVAAVVVNNFTNHLYALAESFCKNEGLDFELLLPLIRETAIRMETITPAAALTGPAIRNDQVTIDKHLELLSRYASLKKIYEDFSASIKTESNMYKH